VLLEKNKEEQLDGSCDKSSTVKNKGGKEHPNAIEQKKANWIRHICRRNCFLKKRKLKLQEDEEEEEEEEDVSSYSWP
jgi:hypothetical protein